LQVASYRVIYELAILPWNKNTMHPSNDIDQGARIHPNFGTEPKVVTTTYEFDHTLNINVETLIEMISDVVSKQTGHYVYGVEFNSAPITGNNDGNLNSVTVRLGKKL
jgi:hypothetical protein